MDSLVEGNVRMQNIKLKKVVEKNPTHIWKIANTLFEGDVWGNISDVNRAALIIHECKQTSLREAVFLGISFNPTATIIF